MLIVPNSLEYLSNKLFNPNLVSHFFKDKFMYFDQRTQDCACVGMVENNSKQQKS